MSHVTEPHRRVEPPLTGRVAPFWTSGAEGVLRICRCGDCGRYQHPPLPVCPACLGASMSFQPVSGRGSVWSWTINRCAVIGVVLRSGRTPATTRHGRPRFAASGRQS